MSRISQWLQAERKKLAPMTPRQRRQYFWGYYRFHALAILLVLALVIGFAAGQHYARQEVLVSGIFINTDTSAAGYSYVSEDYQQSSGREGRVDVIETVSVSYTQNGQPDSEAGKAMASIDAMLAAHSLDYMVMDASALNFYGPLELCMDLEKLLMPEQLASLGDRLVYVEGLESGGTYCAAIDLTGTGFDSRFSLSAQPSYLTAAATGRPEAAAAFIEYFLALTPR